MSGRKTGAADRLARHYALALLEMRGEPKRQKQFVEINVPEGLYDLVKTKYVTALLGS